MKKQKFHYVYRITNLTTETHYYGSRTSKIEPIHDLGIHYFSSSSDKEFITDQINNPTNYKYIIIRLFDTRKEAMLFESHLHKKFNVAHNTKFYNKSNVTSTGFIYGFLGKKHNPESRKKAIEKKVKTMKTVIDDEGNTLYNVAAKKGNQTKKNTILENGLNIHQTASKKYKERLDVIRDGESLSTRDKLKLSPKNTSGFKINHIPDIINIYDNDNNLRFEVRDPLKKFCLENKLPYTELYKSKISGTRLYENITCKRVISILINKEYYKYLGWYAKRL